MAASVAVDNTPPIVASVTLAPEEAYESTAFVAEAEAADADGDATSLEYAWYVDGALVLDGEEPTLDGAFFDRHQEVHVEVRANDGFTDGEAVASDPVTVSNTPPAITGVTLDPAEIFEESVVTCVPAGWTDDDGDTPSYGFQWTVDGVVVGAGETLDGSSFGKGQEVACTATPDDGDDTGTPLASLPSPVRNTPPVISGASLSSTSPYEGDTLAVSLASTSDADGDSVSLGYLWYVSGAAVAATPTLSGVGFDKGDTVCVVVTPSDGTDTGASVTSDTATVLNSAPVITAVELSPTEAFTDSTLSASVAASDGDGDSVSLSYVWYVGTDDDDLVCVVDSDSTDADGDPVSYATSWAVDGNPCTGTASTTHESGDTIDAGATAAGQEWVCTVTPHDGEDTGEAATFPRGSHRGRPRRTANGLRLEAEVEWGADSHRIKFWGTETAATSACSGARTVAGTNCPSDFYFAGWFCGGRSGWDCTTPEVCAWFEGDEVCETVAMSLSSGHWYGFALEVEPSRACLEL